MQATHNGTVLGLGGGISGDQVMFLVLKRNCVLAVNEKNIVLYLTAQLLLSTSPRTATSFLCL